MPSKRKSAASARKDAEAWEGSRKSRARLNSAAADSVPKAEEEAVISVSGSGPEAGGEEKEAGGVLENGDCESTCKSPISGVKEEKEPVVPVQDRGAEEEESYRFIGDPLPEEEAVQRWPHRYKAKLKAKKSDDAKKSRKMDDSEEVVQARSHFIQAEVDGQIFKLEDDAFVKGEEGRENYICKIIEMFEAVDGSPNFTAQWYYRAKDTVIGRCYNLIDEKRVFFSEVKDDNPLDCLVRRLRIEFCPLKDKEATKEECQSTCDYYFDSMYLLPYTSFVCLPLDNVSGRSESDSTISSDADVSGTMNCDEGSEIAAHIAEQTLLDLYSGCGGMSTGLCLGANSFGVKLVTRWAVDLNQFACESLRLNHPETEVRNESAEDFLSLLKEWEKLCAIYLSSANEDEDLKEEDEEEEDGEANDIGGDESEIFEVEEILSICYGDPNKKGKSELLFKIRWKGYGPEEDTWEPIECLSGCKEKLKEFVLRGHRSKLLPLPGSVDVICGGPPCQGISGFNRFRNKDNPLEDPKNKQLVVFNDIVAYLRPKFVLMENVVDIIKFAGGFCGRYALGRLVGMGYQARMGMMAAGAYGLPQFRMRVFVWGALPTEKLPQYPLPTHNVVVRGVVPTEFEGNLVAYDEGHDIAVELKQKLFLGDAISDLPPIANDELRDEIPYSSEPSTEFQQFIRLRRDEMPGCVNFNVEVAAHALYDHRPLQLNNDDYLRVCEIPKKKGANFRDLPGVRVRPDNKVEWDPDVPRVKLPSGKPLVPDYAMSFVGGSSSKPFGRLWWDETVPTVVTRAEPHNQTILHPVQDRVLTIRENARLQGFPDYYKLLGPVKERYIQVGNAVAVPVARALGHSLALALKGLSRDEPLFTLPDEYPRFLNVPSPEVCPQ